MAGDGRIVVSDDEDDYEVCIGGGAPAPTAAAPPADAVMAVDETDSEYTSDDEESEEAAGAGAAAPSVPTFGAPAPAAKGAPTGGVTFGQATAAATTTTRSVVVEKKVVPPAGGDATAGGEECITAFGSVMEQLRISNLERAAKEDVFDSGKHAAYIKAMAGYAGDSSVLRKLRAAREAMGTHCALSTAQWAGWVVQEQQHAETLRDRKYIVEILHRAVDDFPTPAMYLELCTQLNALLEQAEEEDAGAFEGAGSNKGLPAWVPDLPNAPWWSPTTAAGGLKSREVLVRDAFEAAVAHVGGHFTDGATLFQGYLGFIEDEEDTIDEDDSSPAAEQARAVWRLAKAKVYKRLCLTPHDRIAHTEAALKAWTASEEIASLPATDDVRKELASAARVLNLTKPLGDKYQPFEDALKTTQAKRAALRKKMADAAATAAKAGNTLPPNTKAQTEVGNYDKQEVKEWLAYIDAEDVKREPLRQRGVAERAVCSVPWSTTLWTKYIRLCTDAGDHKAAYNAARRAVRSLPRSLPMWLALLRAVECCRDLTFEGHAMPAFTTAALRVRFRSPHEQRHLICEYLSAARRAAFLRPEFAASVVAECERITRAAVNAAKIQRQRGGHAAMHSSTNASAAASSGGSAFAHDFTTDPAALHFVAGMRVVVHRQQQQQQQQQDAPATSAIPAVVTAYTDAIKGVAPLTSPRLLYTEYAAALLAAGAAPFKVREVYEKGIEALQSGGFDIEDVGALADAWLSFERMHGTHVRVDAVRDTHYDAIRKHAAKAAPASARGDTGSASESEDDDADARPAGGGGDDDDERITGRKRKRREADAERKEAKAQYWKDHKQSLGLAEPQGPQELAAFLWNIPFQCTEGDIKGFLKGISIKGIRLIKGKQGRSKGICYVDLEDEATLQEVLKRDKGKMEGRQVRVQRSDPSRSAKPQEDRDAQRLLAKRQKKSMFGVDLGSAPAAPAATAAPAAPAAATPKPKTPAPAGGAKGQAFFKSLLSK